MTTSNLVPVPPNSILGGNQYSLTYNAQANAFTVDGLNSGTTAEWMQENFALISGNANQPFAVGAASLPAQAPQSSQVATDNLKFAADTSIVANTITITLPLPTNTLVNGQPFVVQIANTNTGATSLQILTAAGVTVAKLPVQSMAGALQGGELVASSIWTLRYNSTKKAMVVQGLGAGNPATQSNQFASLGQVQSGFIPSGIPLATFGTTVQNNYELSTEYAFTPTTNCTVMAFAGVSAYGFAANSGISQLTLNTTGTTNVVSFVVIGQGSSVGVGYSFFKCAAGVPVTIIAFAATTVNAGAIALNVNLFRLDAV